MPSFSYQTREKVYLYAGFWRRATASLIDGFMLVIMGSFLKGIIIMTYILSSLELNKRGSFPFFAFIYDHFEFFPSHFSLNGIHSFSLSMINLEWFIYFIEGLIYFACFQSSSWQGTLGMHLVDMKIIDEKGQRISFVRASMRYLVSPLSFMMMGIGYLMIVFTRHKQALHDLITSVYIIRGPLQKTFYLNGE